jgi:acyl-CoA thioesterase FadM
MANNDSAPSKSFQTKIKIRFRDADPAGIMFFGNVLGLAHDVFEEFITANGIPWDEWFRQKDWACPIRHTEVDYLAPFLPGTEVVVDAKVQKLGQNSFGMHYEFRTLKGQLCARVQMIHTFVDQKSFQKTEVPTKYRQLLEQYL